MLLSVWQLIRLFQIEKKQTSKHKNVRLSRGMFKVVSTAQGILCSVALLSHFLEVDGGGNKGGSREKERGR